MLNIKSILNVFGAQNCVLCDALALNNSALCQACIDDLPALNALSCPQCALPSHGDVCGQCLKSPPHFDHTTAVYQYAYPLDALLQHYKYHNALYLSKMLGDLLANKVSLQPVDLIIAMPMHPKRLQQRGFNQSMEIAKMLGKQLNIPVDHTICTRDIDTPPQASLKLKQRIKNIKGAFSVAQQLDGKRIALVDDVMTSGASLNELAKTVKLAGAQEVRCWVISRTL